MSIILFDDEQRINLLPLTYTRPAGDLRVGILTLAEKWELISNLKVSFLSQDYLQEKFPLHTGAEDLYINGRLLATDELWQEISKLHMNESLLAGDVLIASRRAGIKRYEDLMRVETGIKLNSAYQLVNEVHDLFSFASEAIYFDFKLISKGRRSAQIPESNRLIGNNIFIEEGAKVEASILNSESGPIYIGKDAEIMEGSMIRGPFALGEHAVVKMGAKIYGGTSVGPACKVGGELSNVVFQANSNKAHDGFLGNSVIGEWCNIGADSNSSNLKNNYAPVKLWHYRQNRFINTGLQFCGLIMGDHSKCGINTMFNTGTVVGVSANIFGSGFPRNFVPSFTWGGGTGFSTYALSKVYETADKVLARRNLEFGETDKAILKHIFEVSAEHRFWENHSRRV